MSTIVSANLKFKAGGGKEKVRKEGHCRMCRRSAAELLDLPSYPDVVRIMTRHHLVAQSWFRRHPEWKHLMNCDANIVPLCRSCHDLVEMPPDMEFHRRELRRVMTQAEIAFVIQVRGLSWLNKFYPSTKGELVDEPKRERRDGRKVKKELPYGGYFDLWHELHGAGSTRVAA